jgi:MurNAc alpha-1-phosphate uridylyltransferase
VLKIPHPAATGRHSAGPAPPRTTTDSGPSSVDAFILAAGRGSRLRPLTDRTPKPLVEIGGATLIEHHVHRLAAAGISHIVVNVAWLGAQIVESLGGGERFGVSIAYSHEEPGALETAGGIVNALPLVTTDDFVLVNADIFTDFDFADLELPEGSDAELVLVDNPTHHRGGDFALRANRVEMPGPGAATLTYAGIACFRRALFEPLAAGRRALLPVLGEAIARGRITGRHYQGSWFDIGTPERLEEARAAAARPPDQEEPA